MASGLLDISREFGISASSPGSLFGYDVIEPIGQGAGSVLYAVSHPQTNQLYALKHVVRKTDRDARFIDQLENEFEVARQIDHPRLRKAIDLKTTRTFLRRTTEAALILEMFDGLPLDRDVPALSGLIATFIQTAQALGAMHRAGFVHCDLKPSNILRSHLGRVKVIDLGQACKVGTIKQRIQGTPDFISPEQVKRNPVSERTDVFNFGATLYWALTGRKLPTLFTLRNTENSFLLDDHMAAPSTLNPAIPEPLSNLVMECVRTRPTKRPAGMDELTLRLEVIHHAVRKARDRAEPVPA